jgi:4-amino-4-deoxy-L-arabinose transferase-like glycosyltransferase
MLHYELLYMRRWIPLKNFLQPQNVTAFLFLCYWIGFAYTYLSETIFRIWFFSSDEYVLAAEIIRFSQFDFHQHFFDIPGTFYMLLDTPIWLGFYGIERTLGHASDGLGTFTFQHIAGLFVLMRSTTVICFLLSAVLLFILAAKLLNAGAGAFAALLLLMSPAYNGYSSFARTESLAMVCMLSAALLLIYGTEKSSVANQRFWFPEIAAGVCVGLAAGARLHSIVASIPLLVMILWMRKPFKQRSYPAWIVKAGKIVLPASWAAAAILMYLAKRYFVPSSPDT